MLMVLIYRTELYILHKENTRAIVIASKEIGLEVNADITKYMITSPDQNAGQDHNIKIGNKSFERVEKFRYLGTTLTNRNSIQEEIKSRLKSGNACYHSVQNLLYSSLLSKNIKITIYKNVILLVVLYGCESWSLLLREERRLMVWGKNHLEDPRVDGRIILKWIFKTWDESHGLD